MRHDDEIARRGVEGDTSWALTASGLKLIFLKPDQRVIRIADIARSLSKLCRFTGAPSQFYSVAQHSILVGSIIRDQMDEEGISAQTVEYWDQILAGLLHDAEEYVMGDVSSPLKACMGGKYNWIAAGIRRIIYERYMVDWSYHNAIVKMGDNKAILIERFYLMPEHPDWPKISAEEMEYSKPRLMGYEEAERNYLTVVKSALAIRNDLRDEAAKKVA